METVVFLGLALGFIAAVAFAARSAMTVCEAEIVDGKLDVTRGGVAPRVLADLRDIAKRPKIARAHLRIVRARPFARIEITGSVSDAQLQQFRNVIGNVPIARLAAAGSARKSRFL